MMRGMVRMKPGRPRAVTESTPGGLRIAVRTRKNVFLLLFLPVWLVGWAFGEVTVIYKLIDEASDLRGAPLPFSGFLLVWLVGWTLGGGFALLAFVWNAWGREVLEVSRGALRVRHEVLGLGRTREYDLAHVRAVRVSPAPFDPWSSRGALRYWGFGNGVVAFDYGATTVRVLAGVEEAEAAGLVEALGARAPATAARSSPGR